MTTDVTVRRDSLLHRGLQLDAIASGAMGALLLVAGAPTARLLELPVGLLRWVGLACLVWAAVTGWLGTRPVVPRRAAIAVIVFNLVWVVDSIALLFVDRVDPNGLGVAFVLVQAAAVLAVTELQYTGLRRGRT